MRGNWLIAWKKGVRGRIVDYRTNGIHVIKFSLRFSIMFMVNSKHQIQIDNLLKIRNEQIKTVNYMYASSLKLVRNF